ncbi:hypothetical protein TWF718_007854 [Orbilia javanica]|uniref:Uncharacterized protein n=1 Tax=Orbilia javanica TaxID=47235 RepID=A0AAN8MPG7_9PEZI
MHPSFLISFSASILLACARVISPEVEVDIVDYSTTDINSQRPLYSEAVGKCVPDACAQKCAPKKGQCDPLYQKCFCSSKKLHIKIEINNEEQSEVSEPEGYYIEAKCDPDACAQKCKPKKGRCDPLGQKCFCG